MILGDSIRDVDILDDKSKKVEQYIEESEKAHMRHEIIYILSKIYDYDDKRLEADLTRLEIFNPDKNNNICKTDKNKIGALNAMLSFIGNYFDSYNDLCNKIRHPKYFNARLYYFQTRDRSKCVEAIEEDVILADPLKLHNRAEDQRFNFMSELRNVYIKKITSIDV